MGPLVGKERGKPDWPVLTRGVQQGTCECLLIDHYRHNSKTLALGRQKKKFPGDKRGQPSGPKCRLEIGRRKGQDEVISAVLSNAPDDPTSTPTSLGREVRRTQTVVTYLLGRVRFLSLFVRSCDVVEPVDCPTLVGTRRRRTTETHCRTQG